jgi:hypothetical protein
VTTGLLPLFVALLFDVLLSFQQRSVVDPVETGKVAPVSVKSVVLSEASNQRQQFVKESGLNKKFSVIVYVDIYFIRM